MNHRLAAPDILKVAAIIAVIFIHGSYIIPHSNLSASSSDLQLTNIYRFCVPVFILLFSFFQEKSLIKKGNESLMPRLFSLLIPFLFWSAIYFVITADFKNNIVNLITTHWLGYGWSGQYYFIILFQLILLFPFIHWLITKYQFSPIIFFLISLILYIYISYSGWFNINIISKISHRAFVYWIPYVIAGMSYLYKYKIHFLIGIASLLLIPLEIYYLHPQTNSLYLLPSTFISSFILTSSVMQINISYDQINKFISSNIHLIANSTLGIFCLNPLVILGLDRMIQESGLHLKFAGDMYLAPILSVTLILLICLSITYIIKKIRLGKLIGN